MTPYICVTCGTQFTETQAAPENCPICEDERQYIGHDGQQWTTLAELRQTHHNHIEQVEDKLYGVGIEPSFAIGQRALLLCSDEGNILWDCISLLNDATIEKVNELGGISAIAISHPHYYSSVVEWASAFDAKVYLHAADRQWVMRPDTAIEFWKEERLELANNITLLRGGGHFEGGTMLHWSSGANGKGALFTGDIIQVVSDRRWVSFMYSYPNLIPLSAAEVRRIVGVVEPYSFDRIYGAWWDRVILSDAKNAVRRSAERYIGKLEE